MNLDAGFVDAYRLAVRSAEDCLRKKPKFYKHGGLWRCVMPDGTKGMGPTMGIAWNNATCHPKSGFRLSLPSSWWAQMWRRGL